MLVIHKSHTKGCLLASLLNNESIVRNCLQKRDRDLQKHNYTSNTSDTYWWLAITGCRIIESRKFRGWTVSLQSSSQQFSRHIYLCRTFL